MEITSDKHKKFKNVAQKRTVSAIESIKKIGALNNKKTYEWEEKDISKIVKALKNAVSDMEKEFGVKPAKKEEFVL